jgi:NADPH:quinone reductase-like Zn-dependent oxidoreductase
MLCYEIGASTGIDGLRLVERPEPEPGHGWIRIRVHAASLNWRDLEIIGGKFMSVKPPSRIPVSDGAGVVTAVGEGVVKFKQGDRVTCNHFSDWIGGPWSPEDYYPGDLGDNRDGFLTQSAIVPAHCAIKLPDSISFEEASTLPAAGLTAWRMLHAMFRVNSSHTILTLGTGGVSVFTLALAKLAGARVCITSSSDEKLDVMRSLGADLVVNYRAHPAFHNEVLRLTDGRGVDAVFDNAGPATMRSSMLSCAPNGQVFMVGRTAGEVDRQPNILHAYVKNLSIHTLSCGPRTLFEDFIRAWSQNRMKPLISKVFPFEEAKDALRYLQAGAHMGKVVIAMP